jgi:hypothetical protein
LKSYHQGEIFVGVSFRDNNGLILKSKKERFDVDRRLLESPDALEVCGTETDLSSEWTPVVGPIKGSYVIKDGQDINYDYISDFGLYVDDPCQIFDNKMTINLNPRNTTTKDLKFHDGADSHFWLPNIC